MMDLDIVTVTPTKPNAQALKQTPRTTTIRGVVPHGLTTANNNKRSRSMDECDGRGELLVFQENKTEPIMRLYSPARCESPDVSLDCITRTAKGQIDSHPLETLDVNQIFQKRSDSNSEKSINDAQIKLNHSPVKLDDSQYTSGKNTVLTEQSESQEPPLKRMQMEKIPKLMQPLTQGETLASSPQLIEMMDSGNLTSPMKQNNEDLLDIQDAILMGIKEGDAATDLSHQANAGSGGFREQTPTSPNLIDVSKFETLTPLKSHSHQGNSTLHQLKADFNLELKQYEKDIAQKNDKIRQLNQNIVKLTQDYDSVTQELDSTRIKYTTLQTDYKVYKVSQNNVNDQLEEQKETLDLMKQDKEKLEERIAKLKSRNNEFKNEVKMLNQNAQILQEKFQLQIDENVQLAKLNQQLSESKVQAEERLRQLNEETKNYETHAMRLQEEAKRSKLLEQEFNEKKAVYEAKCKELEAAVDEKNLLLEEFQSKLKDSQQKRKESQSELEQQIDELSRERDGLREELSLFKDGVCRESEEAQEKLKQYMSENDQLAKDLKQLNHELDELKGNSERDKEQMHQLKTQLDLATDQLEVKTAEVTEFTQDIDEIKQSKMLLEESIKAREDTIQEWKDKFEDKAKECEKLSIELESINFKSGNLEAEHLADLEDLHEKLTSLQATLKENSEEVGQLGAENTALKSQLEEFKSKNCDLNDKVQKLAHSSALDEELNKKIQLLENQLAEKEDDTNKRLQLLAEDLYIQYSSKHEQKVKMLKKGYETKYQEKLDKLELENAALKEEVEHLNKILATERNEKLELVKLWDDLNNK